MESPEAKGYTSFVTVAVEKNPPYGISVNISTNELIQYGTKEFYRLLEYFNYCLDRNLFGQGYEFWSIPGTFPLDLPGWAKR